MTIYSLDALLSWCGTNLFFMSSSNCCFLTWIQISQEAGQVVWYSHLLKNFPQFVVIHTIKGFGIVNKAEVRGVWISILCFHSLANNVNFETEILRIKWEITWLPLGTVINNIWVCLLTRLNVQNFFFSFLFKLWISLGTASENDREIYKQLELPSFSLLLRLMPEAW